jgi:hypothetical protein
MVSIIIIYIMTLQQQEHSIGSDLEKTTLSIIHITRARLCSEYEFLYKISSHLHLVNSLFLF